MKKLILSLIKAGLVVLLFVALFRPQTFWLPKDFFGGLTPLQIWNVIKESATTNLTSLLFWLAAASGVKLIGIFSGVIRWKLLLYGQGVEIPFGYATYHWFNGRAIGMMTPGTIGLDSWRLLASGTYSKKWVECTTVIVMEKIIGFIALTFLVLVTFPFGFKILNINLFIFAAILCVLLAFTVFCFSILFKPKIIQVLVLALPTPGKVRKLVNRIGAAATAYDGHRGVLLLAVFFGILVHAGTAFMYFCTMNAIRAENTSIYDILFAAPLMIYASVLAPTMGGMGVREIVFSRLLGAKSGYGVAAVFGHLGWWCGEFVPLCLSAPIIIFGGRPSKEQIDAQIAEMRAHVAPEDFALHMSSEEIWDYRKKIVATLFAGIFGGLLAGPIIGLGEAAWLQYSLPGLTEVQMFLWGAVVYGVVFAGVGLGVAGGFIYLYLLFGRFGNWAVGFAGAFAGTLAAGGAVIGLWRLQRDVYSAHGIPHNKAIEFLCYVGGASLISFVIVYIIAVFLGARFNQRVWKLALAGAFAFAAFAFVGGFMSVMFRPSHKDIAFTPPKSATGPNVVLVAVDTLRADYLKTFNPAAVPNTPVLDELFKQSVVFRGTFAQSSWTKPCFATIFSGLYAEQHTATTKTAPLPDSVHTMPEVLKENGYYTAGFPNNPNVAEVFNFQQGFVEYNYLEPSLYLKASVSSSKLTLYEILRRVRQIVLKVGGKIYRPLGKMIVTDFYQPAETVTGKGLEWLDAYEAGPNKQVPFFLYLHYMDPHDPFMDADSPEGGYARVRMENPDPEKFKEPMKHAYIGEIQHLDQNLKPLLDGLKSRGLFDNALIVFVADHGEEFQEHGGWWHGQSLYDELCHVPLALKLPGNALAGTSDTHMARQIDLAPTVLQFAGIQKLPEMTGKPLVTPQNTLDNADITHAFASDDFEGNVLDSARTLDNKLIVSHADSERHHPPVALFDMKANPGELLDQNLAENPVAKPQRDALEQALQQHKQDMQSGHTPAPAAPAAATPVAPGEKAAAPQSQSVKEQLEALGYLGK